MEENGKLYQTTKDESLDSNTQLFDIQDLCIVTCSVNNEYNRTVPGYTASVNTTVIHLQRRDFDLQHLDRLGKQTKLVN